MKKILLSLLLLFSVATLSAQTYEELVNHAMDYVEAEDFAAAEQAMKAALRKEPANAGNTMLLVNLGTIQRNLGKLDEALISYNVALEKYPNIPFLRHNRAALYCELDRFDEAIVDYNTILLTEPEDIEALYRRGLIYIDKNNLFAAEEDFDKIKEISEDNLLGHTGTAMILKRRKEWNEAEKVYSDLIAKHKTNGDLYFNRAECYLEMNKLARTQEDIGKALQLGYSNSTFYILRGRLRLAQYDKRMAKEDFMKAKELGADDAIVQEMLLLCK